MALESLLGAQTLLIKGHVISLRRGEKNGGFPWRAEVKRRDISHALKKTSRY